jgi:hypothetical protein
MRHIRANEALAPSSLVRKYALMQKMSSRTHFVNIMSQQVNIAAIFNFCYFSTLSESTRFAVKTEKLLFHREEQY